MDEYARPRLGVTDEHTIDGIPPGSTSLTPFLAIKGAADATEFLRSGLGARVVDITRIGRISERAATQQTSSDQ